MNLIMQADFCIAWRAAEKRLNYRAARELFPEYEVLNSISVLATGVEKRFNFVPSDQATVYDLTPEQVAVTIVVVFQNLRIFCYSVLKHYPFASVDFATEVIFSFLL